MAIVRFSGWGWVTPLLVAGSVIGAAATVAALRPESPAVALMVFAAVIVGLGAGAQLLAGLVLNSSRSADGPRVWHNRHTTWGRPVQRIAVAYWLIAVLLGGGAATRSGGLLAGAGVLAAGAALTIAFTVWARRPAAPKPPETPRRTSPVPPQKIAPQPAAPHEPAPPRAVPPRIPDSGVASKTPPWERTPPKQHVYRPTSRPRPSGGAEVRSRSVEVSLDRAGLVIRRRDAHGDRAQHLELAWTSVARLSFDTAPEDEIIALYATLVGGGRRYMLDVSHLDATQWSALADAVSAWTDGRLAIDLTRRP